MNMELNLNQTVVNAFRILECFDEKSRSYTCRELSDKLNISNSSTWRLVQTLEYMGYLERLDNDRYSLGLKHLNFTRIILNNLRIRRVASPFLEALAKELKYNVSLGILEGGEVVYLIRIPSPEIPDTYFHIGRRVPVHATALGKALLAFQSEEIQEETIAELAMEEFTPNTITDKELLKQELLDINTKGYALDDEEFIKATRCLAMPIYNHSGKVIAAISISNNGMFETGENGIFQHLDEVAKTAQTISNGTGYSLYNPF